MKECFTRSRSIFSHNNETREICVSTMKDIDIRDYINYNKYIFISIDYVDYIDYRAFPNILLYLLPRIIL